LYLRLSRPTRNNRPATSPSQRGKMDPGRVKAYLQVACTGLGFDIGEIWWATDDNDGSSSRLVNMEEGNNGNGNGNDGKSLKFVQLYTSKSYENRRQMLVRPAEEENESETALVTANGNGQSRRKRNESEKHVLSPLLVDAISKTAQVVWAHTKKQEGLIGRSDVRLQTAVGMPVAVDGNGNMCVVVMFSPNMIQSSDDALEYLQSISKGATSTSIPAMLPAFDPKQGLISLPHHHKNNQMIPLLSDPAMTNGVTTRFVSLDEKTSEVLSLPEIHSTRDLTTAPKDCFGIPMLPNASEIEGTAPNIASESAVSDVFDEASYGVWSTIMDTPENQVRNGAHQPFGNHGVKKAEEEDTEPVYTINKPDMPAARRERLEEFAAAFLEVSVFDVAEVWIPVGDDSDYLGQVTSVTSTDTNPILNKFVQLTEKIMVKSWSGAVGRAYATGNPVWNADQNTFADAGRKNFFNQVRLETALAVPVFHGKSPKPSFVFSCYAFVRSETVPFVLKFVQQALGLLWKGLDQIQPHEAIEDRLWKDVAPADLGEMAADIEMHQHFLEKKRPYEQVNQEGTNAAAAAAAAPSSRIRFDSMGSFSGTPAVNSIYTGAGDATSPTLEPIEVSYQSQQQAPVAPAPIQFQPFQLNVPNSSRDGQNGQQNYQDMFPGEHRAKRARSLSSQGILIQPLINSPRQGITTASPLMSPMPLPSPAVVLISSNHGSRPMQQPRPPQQQQQQQQHQQQDYQNQYSNQGMSSATQQRVQQQQPQQFQFSNQGQSTVSITQLPDQASELAQNFAASYQQQQQHQNEQVNPTPLSARNNNNNNMSAIPTNQISATGISFAVPPNAASKGASVVQNSLPAGSNVVGMQFCLPVGQAMASVPAPSGKPCRIKGCNEPAVTRKPYCARHVGNRMCEHAGCSKCAQGATRFCIAHGGGRRCKFPGCDKGARDKNFCAAHGGGKRCKFDGCSKSAVGGSSLCTAHGGGRRCSIAGCNKSAQSSTKFCVKHGGGKKCIFAGCQKVARGRTEFCAAHGGGVRCKLAGCTRVAIGKSQLCRAHGGGNHSRSKKGSRDDSPPPPMGGPMDGGGMQFPGM